MCPLGKVDTHAHGGSAVLVGLDGDFSILLVNGWVRRSAQAVPAGYRHALDCGDTRMAVLFLLDPAQARGAFVQGFEDHRLRTLARLIRRIDRDDVDAPTATAAIRHALGFGGGVRLDDRVARAHRQIRVGLENGCSIESIAASVHLSPSRLMHLLQSELGIPFRKLRNWERMRTVVQHRAQGDNLTQSCLAAGFADSSHFSRAFRQTFGLTASSVLHPQSVFSVAASDRDEL
ncbi:MAG: helix-turn-helix transcriptional regulator [Myxococcota bacterium]